MVCDVCEEKKPKKIKRASVHKKIYNKLEERVDYNYIYTCTQRTCMIGDSRHRSFFSPQHGEQEGCVGDSSAGLG